MWILSVIILILILGLIILVHEFGHFMWAKKFGVHIYEFSIGMGPILHTHKGKDKIDYNIRAIPIGGFVAMAGEVYEDDDTKKIPKNKFLCNRPWWQRLIILVAGVVNNFILALLLLFISALIWGSSSLKPVVNEAVKGYPVYTSGIKDGDEILSINGHKTKTWDIAQIVLAMKNNNIEEYFYAKLELSNNMTILIPIINSENVSSITESTISDSTILYNVEYKDGIIKELEIPLIDLSSNTENVSIVKTSVSEPIDGHVWMMKIKHQDGVVEEVKVIEAKEISSTDEERNVLGIIVGENPTKGVLSSIKYTFKKFWSIIVAMWLTVVGLITGKISLGALSGPVGMYQVVEQARTIGIDYLIYITAFLSVNVGFINILPFPAFDGGHVLFLIIEKIKGKPVDAKLENLCHTIGFILLLILMIVVTIQDIIRLF